LVKHVDTIKVALMTRKRVQEQWRTKGVVELGHLCIRTPLALSHVDATNRNTRWRRGARVLRHPVANFDAHCYLWNPT
jgi:hypothetical protein